MANRRKHIIFRYPENRDWSWEGELYERTEREAKEFMLQSPANVETWRLHRIRQLCFMAGYELGPAEQVHREKLRGVKREPLVILR